jgi:hypothetical protein
MTVTDYDLSSLIPTFWGNNVAIYTWTDLAADSSGQPVSGPGYTDRSFQVSGSFGGATVVIEGSNDGVNYFTLRDPFAVPLSFTAPDLREVTEMALWMRPRVIGGAGTAVDVISVMCNHQNN